MGAQSWGRALVASSSRIVLSSWALVSRLFCFSASTASRPIALAFAMSSFLLANISFFCSSITCASEPYVLALCTPWASCHTTQLQFKWHVHGIAPYGPWQYANDHTRHLRSLLQHGLLSLLGSLHQQALALSQHAFALLEQRLQSGLGLLEHMHIHLAMHIGVRFAGARLELDFSLAGGQHWHEGVCGTILSLAGGQGGWQTTRAMLMC